MERPGFVENFFSAVTGVPTTVVPERVVAECLKPANTPSGRVRPPISFSPSDPDSVARARNAAKRHVVPRGVCEEHCNLPCSLRRLEDLSIDRLMATFNQGNVW